MLRFFRDAPVAAAVPASLPNAMREILQRRMARPQRHRLLHSFPLAAAMPTVQMQDADLGFRAFPFGQAAELLVGLLVNSVIRQYQLRILHFT